MGSCSSVQVFFCAVFLFEHKNLHFRKPNGERGVNILCTATLVTQRSKSKNRNTSWWKFKPTMQSHETCSHVLTAAHCINPNLTSVRVGQVDRVGVGVDVDVGVGVGGWEDTHRVVGGK